LGFQFAFFAHAAACGAKGEAEICQSDPRLLTGGVKKRPMRRAELSAAANANSSPARQSEQADSAAQLGPLLNTLVDEIRDLKRVSIKIATQRPHKTQFIWSVLLQVFALFVGFVFGIFAILAWIAARVANDIATSSKVVGLQSNQIALMTYCLTIPDVNASDVCLAVQSLQRSQIGVVANETFGSLLYGDEPSNGTLKTPSDSGHSKLGGGDIAGIVLGAVSGVALIMAISTTLFKRRMTSMEHLQTYLEQTDPRPMRNIPGPKASELDTESPPPSPSAYEPPSHDPPGHPTAHMHHGAEHDKIGYSEAQRVAKTPEKRH
jgi:hypothetical protein